MPLSLFVYFSLVVSLLWNIANPFPSLQPISNSSQAHTCEPCLLSFVYFRVFLFVVYYYFVCTHICICHWDLELRVVSCPTRYSLYWSFVYLWWLSTSREQRNIALRCTTSRVGCPSHHISQWNLTNGRFHEKKVAILLDFVQITSLRQNSQLKVFPPKHIVREWRVCSTILYSLLVPIYGYMDGPYTTFMNLLSIENLTLRSAMAKILLSKYLLWTFFN